MLSVFVITYFLACAAKLSWLDERAAPAWPFCVDAAVDILAKLVYSSWIVDAHGSLLGSAELSEQQFGELRELMSAVWTVSSDALAVSVRRSVGHASVRVETSVSPTAVAMLLNAELETFGGFGDAALLSVAVAGSRTGLRLMRFHYDDNTPAGDLLPVSAVWPCAAADGADARSRAGSAETSGFAELIRRAWIE